PDWPICLGGYDPAGAALGGVRGSGARGTGGVPSARMGPAGLRRGRIVAGVRRSGVALRPDVRGARTLGASGAGGVQAARARPCRPGGSVRISVVTAAWNATWCIERALESVLAQTLPALEVLVCDDG